jgi:hypothetical protein
MAIAADSDIGADNDKSGQKYVLGKITDRVCIQYVTVIWIRI